MMKGRISIHQLDQLDCCCIMPSYSISHSTRNRLKASIIQEEHLSGSATSLGQAQISSEPWDFSALKPHNRIPSKRSSCSQPGGFSASDVACAADVDEMEVS